MPEERYPIKTYLINGFLGAGKTTFILEYLKTAGPKGANTAVLVNEFGKLGIDGETIKNKGGIDVVEMPGGCICCSQKQGLVASIKDIAEQVKADLLLIEPSGVAEASELLITLSNQSLKGTIRLEVAVTVIDATTFLEFSEPEAFGTFFLDQVENADVVLVNKQDLVDGDTLKVIEQRIKEINPQAVIVRTEYCRFDSILPSGRVRGKIISHRADLGLNSVSVEPTLELPHDALERFLTGLAEGNFGNIFRAKGFLNVKNYGCISIQITPGQVSVELLSREVAPRLTLIGYGLEETAILGYFEQEIV